MKNSAVELYCKKVGKQIICSPETRRELLDGLRSELAELPPEKTNTVHKLEIHYGKIPEIAVSLQDAVSPEERTDTLDRKRIIRNVVIGAVIVVFIFLSLLIYFLDKDGPGIIVFEDPVVESTGDVASDAPSAPPEQ